MSLYSHDQNKEIDNNLCIFVGINLELSQFLNLRNFHRLTMGKMKIGIYCYFIADILTKVFLEMFVEWSSTKNVPF